MGPGISKTKGFHRVLEALEVPEPLKLRFLLGFGGFGGQRTCRPASWPAGLMHDMMFLVQKAKRGKSFFLLLSISRIR